MLSFLRENFRWIAGGFLLTYFSSIGQTFFVSASIAEWQARFNLSHGEIGRLYMLATLGSAACLPFVGRIMDVIPAHRVVAGVAPVLAIAALMAGNAVSIPVLVIAIFLLRLFGQGMMTHIALTATGRWFVAERGRAVSLVVLGHQGGEATLPLIFAAVTIAYGHTAGWTSAAVALVAIGLPLIFWSYRVPRIPHGTVSKEVSRSQVAREWERREVLRDPVFWTLLTGVLAPPFIGTTIFYHQNYLTALFAWPPQLYAQGLLVMAMTTVTFALLSGWIIDRVSAKNVLSFFLLPLTAACFALGFAGSEASLFVVMILLGISYGFSSTLFGALWPEIYGTKNLGAIRSVTVSAAVLATAAGPGVTGSLIDYGIELPSQMVFLGFYCLLAVVAMASASAVLRKRSEA